MKGKFESSSSPDVVRASRPLSRERPAPAHGQDARATAGRMPAAQISERWEDARRQGNAKDVKKMTTEANMLLKTNGRSFLKMQNEPKLTAECAHRMHNSSILTPHTAYNCWLKSGWQKAVGVEVEMDLLGKRKSGSSDAEDKLALC